MPLVACPKCATTLKIPDGASGNVKCPKCTNIFPVAAKPTAASGFEVLEGGQAKPAAPKPAQRPEPLEPDFEVVDEPKPKRKAAASADDDDDDRPRSKRRRDYDDDDDDDNRPRKKKKKRRDYDDDEDDDDWRPSPSRGGGGMGNAKVGTLLVSISFWFYFSLYALGTFLIFLLWVGVTFASDEPRGPGDESSFRD